LKGLRFVDLAASRQVMLPEQRGMEAARSMLEKNLAEQVNGR
jgi:hypothetical protein